MDFKKPPILTEPEELILTILKSHSAYGLQMIKESDGVLKKSSIYARVRQLKELGLISSTVELAPQGEKGPPRVLHSITPEGKKILTAWLKWKDTVRKVCYPDNQKSSKKSGKYTPEVQF